MHDWLRGMDGTLMELAELALLGLIVVFAFAAGKRIIDKSIE